MVSRGVQDLSWRPLKLYLKKAEMPDVLRNEDEVVVLGGRSYDHVGKVGLMALSDRHLLQLADQQ